MLFIIFLPYLCPYLPPFLKHFHRKSVPCSRIPCFSIGEPNDDYQFYLPNNHSKRFRPFHQIQLPFYILHMNKIDSRIPGQRHKLFKWILSFKINYFGIINTTHPQFVWLFVVNWHPNPKFLTDCSTTCCLSQPEDIIMMLFSTRKTNEKIETIFSSTK